MASGEPRFSHRENFADFCDDLVASGEPRFSHRENFAIYCEDLMASGGRHDGATFFSQRKFCDLL